MDAENRPAIAAPKNNATRAQALQIAEDDPDPDGAIKGAASHGYERTISLDLLATGAIPAVGATLVIAGAPTHAANYLITSADQKFAQAKGKMYSIEAAWIPPFSA